MSANALVLECRQVSIDAGPRRLLDALDWQVRAGEFWCVLGANGAGKTHLLSAVAGLLAPRSGEIRVAGRALAQWPALELARVRGFLPQGIDAPFGLSVFESVMLGRHPYARRGLADSSHDRACALAALAALDIADLAPRALASLSGGERQRAALAGLLAQAPALYLLDEPLTHLDLRHQVLTMRMLRSLAGKGAAVVAAIHDASLVARHASHALLFGADGTISAGPLDSVLDAPTLSAAMGFPMRRIEQDGLVNFVAEDLEP